MITDCFELRFEGSIEAICEIVLILHAEFAKEYQAHHVIRDCARE